MVASLLVRHASTLQKLDLTLWTLSLPIAQAITTLPALRDFSLRLESAQAVPRAYTSMLRKEERTAWALLAATPEWTHSLRALRIENTGISVQQLLSLIEGAARLRDLRLSSCDMLTSSMWDASLFRKLSCLSVTDCANVHVTETAVGVISKMQRLQTLDLRGCNGLDGEVLEQWNKNVWRVPVFVAPRPRGFLKEDLFIEVDPDYMLEPI
ncbi:hypothetical protein OPT61_g929 [Boeremia exigua]|uniref:Uncharacterized protein n=1 Tax=Boeremia exigua TaxID=749465 RepID=A0ACC2IS52_9PLEO|nr:hypothetical protein OPT61_g929 [Boeremia exigua]